MLFYPLGDVCCPLVRDTVVTGWHPKLSQMYYHLDRTLHCFPRRSEFYPESVRDDFFRRFFSLLLCQVSSGCPMRTHCLQLMSKRRCHCAHILFRYCSITSRIGFRSDILGDQSALSAFIVSFPLRRNRCFQQTISSTWTPWSETYCKSIDASCLLSLILGCLFDQHLHYNGTFVLMISNHLSHYLMTIPLSLQQHTSSPDHNVVRHHFPCLLISSA